LTQGIQVVSCCQARLQGHLSCGAMPFEQIHASSGEGHMTEEEAFLQTSRGEAVERWRLKLGIASSVILAGAGLILAVLAPREKDSTRSIVPEAVVSLRDHTYDSKYNRYTSPFFASNDACKEADIITTDQDCGEAGQLIKPGLLKYREGKQCMAVSQITAVLSHSHDGGIYLCKSAAHPDWAELRDDLDKLTVHCLRVGTSYGEYQTCMLQIKSWHEEGDKAADEADEADGAADGAADEAADEADRAAADAAGKEEKHCWLGHDSTYSGGYARRGTMHGVQEQKQKMDLEQAKKLCLELSECAAITCKPDQTQCTVRSSKNLKHSSSGEWSFTYDC